MLEQRSAPGGRASQLRDGRLHLGHRAVADHDAVGARGGVRRRRARPALRGDAAPAGPAVPDPLGGRGAARWTSSPTSTRLREEIAALRRARRRARCDGFLDGAEADLRGRAPRRPGAARSRPARSFAALLPTMVAPARDPCRCTVRLPALPAPAGARGVLVPLAVHRRRPVPRAGDLRRARLPAAARRRLVRRRRRVLAGGGDGAAARRALRRAAWRRSRPRATACAACGSRAASGSRPTSSSPTPTCCARTSCSAAARRGGGCGRRCPCFLLYLGTDRRFDDAAAPHAAGRPRVPRLHPRRDARRAACRRRYSTYVHAPARTEAAMAAPGGDSLAVLLPGAEPARGDRLGPGRGRAARRGRRRPGADVRADAGSTPRCASSTGWRRRTSRASSAPWTATRSRSSRRCTSRRTSARPNRVPGVRGLYHVGGGTHPGAGIPGVLMGAEVTAGLVDGGRGGAARERGARRGAATTQPVARTFALACRLLPRDVRDDVYLLYLVFRTLDDLVDEGRPEAAERVAAVERWAAGRRRPTVAGGRASSRTSRRATPCRATRCSTSAPACATTSGRPCTRPRPTSTATATASPGRSGVVMTVVLGAARLRARPSRRRGARHGDAAHEHPARHRRGRRERPGLRRARDARRASAVARAGPPRARCCATRSPAPTRSTTRASRASASCAAGAARSPPRPTMYREVLRQLEREGYGARPGRAVVPRRRKLTIAARAALRA